ncbi:MAG: carboxypeptidase-like regulatory domain-containing protein [Chloroflexi bacterium]|nr:carboxypeptidase-like regulatory domain-containing protein [Chloroflexota bacterium]
MSAYRRRRLRLPRLPAFSPLPFAVLLVAGVAWYHFGFGGFNVRGTVLDSATGQPISGARVWTSRANTASSADGSFALESVKPPEILSFDAPGYRDQSVRVSTPLDPVTSKLEPIGVEIDAVDADTGQPVAAALDTTVSGNSVGPGRISIAPVRANQKFNLTADGYIPTETYYSGQDVR